LREKQSKQKFRRFPARTPEYKKLDLTLQIQAVFAELLAIHNKSEKLYEKALSLFDKDKSYSPKAIEGMATGESIPSKWLVACAIDILIDEKLDVLKTTLSTNDIFLLWAKQLLDNNHSYITLVERAQPISNNMLIDTITNYTPNKEPKNQ
jgi:hypothetical protein